MQGKTVLVTGANAGIGKWTAIALAEQGATIVAAARSASKGQRAVEEIRRRGGNDRVELRLADFSSLADVRRLAAEVAQAHPSLDVLVNNAGLIQGQREETRDGFEVTFGVNHLAPFLLTLLLEPALRAAAPSRVVNVASRAHTRAALDFDDLQSRRGYQSMQVYGRSKLANILFTRELARRWRGSGVSANCLHPGVVRSDFGADGEMGPWMAIGWALIKPFLISPRRGAETSVYLASSPEVEGISGEYFDRCRVSRSSRRSQDMDVAARLWAESAEMVGLTDER
ncbi:MAG: SDR family oxidoreductase [Acidobacteriota bacterium]|nr:SDR family oxidoreductase [Acidobacteriota bacterium]